MPRPATDPAPRRVPELKVIAIANQKGGVGKTTTAVNLSACLAELGRKILLLDLDPQGNATSAIGLSEQAEGSIYKALIGDEKASELILETRIPNLHAIPANLDLAGSEVDVARMDDHLSQLRRSLRKIRKQADYDFAILDCPPSLGILMLNALVAADELLVPIQSEYYALEGLGKLMQVTEQIRSSQLNEDLAISGLVMTMFDVRTNLSEAVVQDVRKHFEEVAYETVIPRTVRLSEAPSFSKTIIEYDPRGTGAEAYRKLAGEFLARQSKGMSFVSAPDSVPGS